MASVETIVSLIQEKSQLCISPLVLDEFLYVLSYILKKTGTSELLDPSLHDILQLPELKIITTPAEKEAQAMILNYMEHYSLRPRDAYHLLTMKYHDITHFFTFDTDFEKVFKKGEIAKV